MKRWQGSCSGALLVLLICGGSLIFFVPFGGAMIAWVLPYSTGSLRMCFVLMRQIIPTGIMAARQLTRPIPAAGQVILLN
jgi:hypothetical protein